jgi:predicted small lipoprotein YifL
LTLAKALINFKERDVMIKVSSILLIALMISFLTSACGRKGPPLPPEDAPPTQQVFKYYPSTLTDTTSDGKSSTL